LEAQLAEQQARTQPLNPNAADTASKARARADESRRSVDSILSLPAPVERSRALKDLYRAAAKQLHPDLAQDDKDRTIRHRLMAEANLAYEKGDENRLREILDEYNSNPDLVPGNDVGAELVRTIRKISLATSKIKKVETEVHGMSISELAKLRATVNEGNIKGEDVLENLARSLRNRIQEKRRHFGTV
jgi:DnaJ-class molecular chaperone